MCLQKRIIIINSEANAIEEIDEYQRKKNTDWFNFVNFHTLKKQRSRKNLENLTLKFTIIIPTQKFSIL